MLIGCFGDLHYTDRCPINRMDEDFLLTINRKLEWAYDNPLSNCDIIVYPGDVFDSFKASDYLKQRLIYLLNFWNKETFVVYGQHDLRYHSSNRENTPLKVLEAANSIQILVDVPTIRKKISFYGASWGEEIPPILNRDSINVLVLHKMFLKNEKLWQGQKDYTMARAFLRSHEFDLVISGDNHQCFTDSYDKKYLINMGSVVRRTIDQINHQPSVAVFDTDWELTEKTTPLTVYPIPIIPSHEIFKMDEVQQEKERSKKLEAFIEGLSESNSIEGLDFSRNIEIELNNRRSTLTPLQIEIIEESLEWKKSKGN